MTTTLSPLTQVVQSVTSSAGKNKDISLVRGLGLIEKAYQAQNRLSSNKGFDLRQVTEVAATLLAARQRDIKPQQANERILSLLA